MSVQAVRDYLKQFHLDDKVEEFTQSSATVEELVQSCPDATWVDVCKYES